MNMWHTSFQNNLCIRVINVPLFVFMLHLCSVKCWQASMFDSSFLATLTETGSEDDGLLDLSEDDFFLAGSSSDEADADDEWTDKSTRWADMF